MIAGTDLFLGLFNNLALFIILVAVYGALHSRLGQNAQTKRQAVLGVAFGLFAIGCMYVKIPVAEGVIVDQRNTIVTLSGTFGGPLAAVICAIMTGSYRVYLGGSGALAGVIGVFLSAVAGAGLHKLRGKIDRLFKAALGALAATLIILPGFLFIGDLQAGWALMQAMALPYGAAIFLGILLVGLLLVNQEHRLTAVVEQKKSEKRFRELFENLIDVSYRTDHEGRFSVISPSAERIFGYRPEELIGRKIADFYKDPSLRDALLRQIRRDGHVENFEAEIKRKDGTFVWVSTNANLLRDAAGVFRGIEGVTRDISQLKKSQEEKVKLEESLPQSHKLEAIGTLAGGIAHDFNNILASIIGYAEMAYEELPHADTARSYIQEVLKAGIRAKDLVKHILTFSRKSEQAYAPVQINAIVSESLKLLRASIPSTIAIQQNIDAASGTVIADPTELHQIIINLCTNAAQAMEANGGTLTVGLARVALTADHLQDDPALSPGAYVKLTVGDTGHGIVPEHLDRIFDPFFTTKEVGKGSGLGLAVVHGIVKRHKGLIRVASRPGQGTTFNLFFPLVGNAEERTIPELDALPTGNERLLVVDDELGVVEVTRQRLARLGYQVVATTSSTEALDLFRAQPQAFDLVITDQAMPGISGEQLAQALMALRPDIRIILCTGYSSIVDAEKSKSLGVREFLIKPIEKKDLARTIRCVLDQ